MQGGNMSSPGAKSSAGIENLILNITQELHVRASLEGTFTALLEQIGPQGTTPEGNPLPMKIEPWPGGRWYRDLGDNNGHLWGHVQAIKRPTLLEITGPLFMSYAVVSNVQYRLSEEPGGTLIKFHHKAFGLITDEHREGVVKGWNHILDQIRVRAEAGRSR
jgi:Activator of Hsp90 ATPase homolog 1-like protein